MDAILLWKDTWTFKFTIKIEIVSRSCHFLTVVSSTVAISYQSNYPNHVYSVGFTYTFRLDANLSTSVADVALHTRAVWQIYSRLSLFHQAYQLLPPFAHTTMLVLILILFHFTREWNNPAPYIDSSTEVFTRNTTSFEPLICICTEQRSVSDIVWSCLATLFACSWVSVHPDIPNEGERWWSNILQRIEFMSWTILSPEFVMTWAGRQWIGARRIAREQSKRACSIDHVNELLLNVFDTDWTVTHGHFLQMGGFMLYKAGEKKGVLSYDRFKMLLHNKKIEFPQVTREEIEDRSKSDGLCKALVIGQTSWFILQCIARRINHLPITELELATLAFAALNGCMYFCWWDKPFDVRIPIPVQLLPEEPEEITQAYAG